MMTCDSKHTRNWTITEVKDDASLDLEIDRTVLASIGAHELREPVQAVRSFLAVVLDGRTGPLTELQEDFLKSASEAARRVGRLIDDVQLILSEGQELDFRCRPVSLAERLQACCRELSQIAEGNTIELLHEIDGGTNYPIYGDADRVDQILLNILENAIQYSPSGSMVFARLHETSNGEWSISVENEVESASDPAAWLEPFNRGGRTGGRGIGLGLTVVQMLLQAHRGRLTFLTADDRVRACLYFPKLNEGDVRLSSAPSV